MSTTAHAIWRVVILTHNEELQLITNCFTSVKLATRQLNRLASQVQVAVLVVDDSSEKVRSAIAQIAADTGFEYVYAKLSLPAKRNYGWRARLADVVVYIDADCVASSDWLVEHYRAMNGDLATAGVVGITSHECGAGKLYQAMDHNGMLTGFRLPELMDYSAWGPCSNISISTAALAQVGGFDEHFSCASEDVDLGLRINEATGRYFRCSSGAIVAHATAPFARGIQRRVVRWSAGEALLLARHPAWRICAPPSPAIYSGVVLALIISELILQHSAWPAALAAGMYWLASPMLEARRTQRRFIIVLLRRLLALLSDLSRIWMLLRLRRAGLIQAKMNYGEGHYMHCWDESACALIEFVAFVFCVLLLRLP